jgi:hypothetical protein
MALDNILTTLQGKAVKLRYQQKHLFFTKGFPKIGCTEVMNILIYYKKIYSVFQFLILTAMAQHSGCFCTIKTSYAFLATRPIMGKTGRK